MRISFKETNNGKTNEIYYDNQYIGDVDLNLWSSKWNLKPKFNLAYYVKENVSKEKYDSAYKAGKELVRLYKEKVLYALEEPIDEDTQEIDMRDMFKSFHIP
tara:strand:- start:332 stop:637 length:306 start_codon:yes stop_codon:yes gene_type:complete